MNRKKSLYVLGMLTFILLLGVGYATVSSVGLNIDGTATVASESLKVAFNGDTDVSNSSKVEATATDDSLNATISVKDLKLNESVTATYTIKNSESDVDANILKSSISNDKSEFFKVTTSVDDRAASITAGATADVTVTVQLIKTPIEAEDSTANIQIDLSATPVN